MLSTSQLRPVLTSSVSTPIAAAALVATTGAVAAVVALVAAAATAAEATLPVVKAFVRGRPGAAAVVIVLFQQLFSFVTLQLSEGHGLQEVADLREGEVGFGRAR